MTPTTEGVALAHGETGSAFFLRILNEAAQRFPALAQAQLPANAGAFKKHYGEALVGFEAARIASPQRVAIAQVLHQATLSSLRFVGADGERPLVDVLTASACPPPKTLQRQGTGGVGLVPEVPLDGHVYRGAEVGRAIDKLHVAHHLTDRAAAALRWVVDLAASRGGALRLEGERFVLFGASAELSPLPLLTQAGATVRCLDVKAPPPTPGPGTVIWTEGGDDLLAAPQAALAAVRDFAQPGPVHLGLFAYAPGAMRELRLAGAMEAIVQALTADVVKSVALYISPTSPGEVQPEDLFAAAEKGRAPKVWQRGFQAARMLKRPGHVGENHSPIARGIISLQGAGYQAAQYLTKLISAEVLATSGLGGKPVTVSANVAGITNTRSLSHPLFQVGFKGAANFGVRIFEPETTRALSGLLMLHDLLNPEAPGSGARTWTSAIDRARAVRSEQIHGGVYGLPWQFESAVRTAAVIGLGKRPDLLFRRAR